MTRLAIHDLSRKKSHTEHKNNMNLTAKMQAVIEEITLDVRDLLRSMVGQANDDATRTMIQSCIQDYLSDLEDIQIAQVICDESNNTYDMQYSGRCAVDISFIACGSSFEAKFKLNPGPTPDQPEITHDFFLLQKFKPTPAVAMIQLDDVLKAAENIPAFEQEVEVYAEMSSALASSLKV